jgi:hypothetical protein
MAQYEARGAQWPHVAFRVRQFRAYDLLIDTIEHRANANEAAVAPVRFGGNDGAFHIDRESAGSVVCLALGRTVLKDTGRSQSSSGHKAQSALAERGAEGGHIGRSDRSGRRREAGSFRIENQTIGEHEVAGVQPLIERSGKPGCNHEVRRSERSQRAPRDIRGPIDPKSGGDPDDFRAAEPRAKASQALDTERCAIGETALERADLARECVKDQDHRVFSLSRAALTSKIAPVGPRIIGIVTQAERIGRVRPSP